MNKVNSLYKYDYYVGKSNNRTTYNIVPKGSNKPTGGYYSKEYISKIKNVNIFGFDGNNEPLSNKEIHRRIIKNQSLNEFESIGADEILWIKFKGMPNVITSNITNIGKLSKLTAYELSDGISLYEEMSYAISVISINKYFKLINANKSKCFFNVKDRDEYLTVLKNEYKER